MPELPEVETTARGLRASIVGRRVVDVGGVDWPRMLPNATEAGLRAALAGTTVTGVERRGKYLLLQLGGMSSLAIHRKMSGNLLLQPADAARPLHTHFTLRLEDDRELRLVDPRKFGRVYWLPDPAERERVLGHLGPEPLGISIADLATLLRARRGRIKSLLLDQAFLAGLGNLYADEALWEARIHPLRMASSLSAREATRLAEAIQQVLTSAIMRRGTSFSDYRDEAGERGENQDYLRAYGRHGQPCPRCGEPLLRQTIAQRGSHYCPRCQTDSR